MTCSSAPCRTIPISPANCPNISRARVQDKFPDSVQAHRLRREIISTNLANAVINRGGPACVVRLIDETDADVPTIAMAFVAVDESYGLKSAERRD